MSFTTLIDAAALRALVEAGDAIVVDCRFDLADPAAGRTGYLAGHVPGARYLHLDEDLSGPATGRNGRHPLPDPQAFAETLRGIGLRTGQQLVAYDDAGGPYAARLWWLARWIGHEAVAVLDGGLQAWIAAGGALEPGAASVGQAGDVAIRMPDSAATIDAAGVRENIEHAALLVVDARAPERFRGDPNPMDPVAGHIPGAANRFFKDNLDADGRFKTPDALAADWHAVLGDRPASVSVMQCGSGVTACHNLLALAVAGMPGAKLYPGSWSEWIADPSRPVARE